ncbi:MAG: hypothetical protein ACRD3R_00045 [Terriglobales bacterium]
MKEEPHSHSLLSFTRYLDKVFHFAEAAAGLRDARHDPDFPPPAVFRALFYGFVFRLSSFKQLEADLAEPHLQRFVGVERPFRDDTLRYSLCGFELEPLEQMLVDVNRRLKRSKAFDPGRVQGRIVAALDGIEVLSSYSRCCDCCLQRRVTSHDAEGQPVERLQYYHRAVACQIVSAPVKSILAVEWLQPGEGEDTAALRLLARLPQLYGSRFFDILLLDSLYPQAPVLRLAQQIGWDLVLTLKQEKRDLYQSAMRLFESRPPDEEFTEQLPGKCYQVRLWETDGLPFTEDYPQPVRVLWSQEKLTQNHYRQQKLQPETTSQEWLWVTTLDARVFRGPVVRRLGHDRWKQENNGWNDLTQNWALKHGFLHACKHRPRQPAPDGTPQPVPNRGLAAVTLILGLAFVLCSAFTLLHSKLVRLYRLSLREVSRQLYRSVWRQPPIRAPA